MAVSLADALRRRSDAELADLLTARPDLVAPVPADLGVLAARASTAGSVARAVDRLDRFTLQVLETAAGLPEPVTVDTVAAALPVDRDPVEDAVRTLLRLGLAWEPPEGLRVPPAVRAFVAPPAGLGPPLPAGGPHTDPDALAQALLGCGPAERDVLARLTWGPPVGRRGRATAPTPDGGPVDRLLLRGLLLQTDAESVVLPAQIALMLRDGMAFRPGSVSAEPPGLGPPTVAPQDAQATAASTAVGVVRLVEELLESWSVDPPAALRSGGVGVREVRRVADQLDVEEATAGLLVEVAAAAGLVGRDELEWLPTVEYDAWSRRPAARQWADLAAGWLTAPRLAARIGHRDERGRAANALSAELELPAAAEVRLLALRELAAATPGVAADVDSLVDALGWRRPRRWRGSLLRELVAAAVHEAGVLGVLGRGAATDATRALVDADARGLGGDDTAALAAAAMDPHLPEPVDEVLLQADLTAVAPGPLVPQLAREMALLADIESRGGATVYRFTESSVRRALDAGRSASDITDLLRRHSRTPVPQPLGYLVDDLARRHGRLRVGVASAYLRCDDPTVLDELFAHRQVTGLGLRRLAPTVAVAAVPPAEVLEEVRAAGFAPAAEDDRGGVVVRRPDARRAVAASRPPRITPMTGTPPATLVAAAVRALRAGERTSTAGRGVDAALPRTSSADTLAVLRDASDGRGAVEIGYVNAEGFASRRLIEPLSVQGGFVTAFDHRRGEVRTFALHRITGVAAAAIPDADATGLSEGYSTG